MNLLETLENTAAYIEARGGRPIEISTSARLWQVLRDSKTEIEALQAIVDPINRLRRDEGDAVTILCDSPDFGGPASAVIASGSWCGFAEQRYFADSLAEALATAVKDREECEAAEAQN